MLRKLRRSIARNNLRRMGAIQITKRQSKGRMVDKSYFSYIWKKYDHWMPVAPKRAKYAK